jgi:hypothetical protein
MKYNKNTSNLNEFCDWLKTQYEYVSMWDLVYLRKLINLLESRRNSDFNKLTVEEIDRCYPYWILELRHASIPVFLLYKKLI